MCRIANIRIYAPIAALAAGIALAGEQIAGDPSAVRAMAAFPGCDLNLERQDEAFAQTAIRSGTIGAASILQIDIHDSSECERKRSELVHSTVRDAVPSDVRAPA
ncbi:MAG: hypothetical protein IT539_03640 [Bradyrhizobiaceae bacterium]|nr:hypothetical protein [Bradyrhizobiaceae bacterium]